VKFKTFNKQEHDSDVPPRKIQRIVEDKNGYIWVKTIDRKLYVFNKVTECFHAVYDDMKNYSENIQVIKLQNTAEGDVLLLTKDKNLLLAGVDEKGQVTIKILFDSRDEINKHDYTLKHHVLCETEEYISWIGTDYKVSAVHKGAELASRPADFITSKINSGDKDSFTSFFEDGRKVWVGDRAGIFYSIDVRTGLVNRYVLSEIKGAISNLLVTPAGYVYLSVAGQGTYEYDLAERRLQKINTEMNDAMVTHAFIDQYDIGSFYIVKESGVSAGVRRIEAVCGTAAIKYTKDIISKMNEIQAEVKNSDVILGIKKLKEQIKDLKKEIETSQSKTSSPIEETIINDTKVIVSVVENGDLKKIVDDTKNANEKVAIFLLQAKDDKVLIVAGSKNTNIKAGDWIKNIAPIVGGGGGGRPDFAQAGGKDVTKVEDAKIAALTYAKENL
jgi:hypothetical protein